MSKPPRAPRSTLLIALLAATAASASLPNARLRFSPAAPPPLVQRSSQWREASPPAQDCPAISLYSGVLVLPSASYKPPASDPFVGTILLEIGGGSGLNCSSNSSCFLPNDTLDPVLHLASPSNVSFQPYCALDQTTITKAKPIASLSSSVLAARAPQDAQFDFSFLQDEQQDELDSPSFLNSVIPTCIILAATTTITYILFLSILCSDTAHQWPRLQLAAVLLAAVTLTVTLVLVTRYLHSQALHGYYSGPDLFHYVDNSLPISILFLSSTVLARFAGVQVLLRLFRRPVESRVILGIGVILILTYAVIWAMFIYFTNTKNDFIVDLSSSYAQSSAASSSYYYNLSDSQEAVSVFGYLFKISMSILYCSCVCAYCIIMRNIAFRKDLLIIALFSLVSILLPIILFFLDIADNSVSVDGSWADFVELVALVGSTVVLYEWLRRIEALEKKQQANSVLGKQLYLESDVFQDRKVFRKSFGQLDGAQFCLGSKAAATSTVATRQNMASPSSSSPPPILPTPSHVHWNPPSHILSPLSYPHSAKPSPSPEPPIEAPKAFHWLPSWLLSDHPKSSPSHPPCRRWTATTPPSHLQQPTDRPYSCTDSAHRALKSASPFIPSDRSSPSNHVAIVINQTRGNNFTSTSPLDVGPSSTSNQGSFLPNPFSPKPPVLPVDPSTNLVIYTYPRKHGTYHNR